ncbi:MAG: hypothetical protein MK110_07925 [Fuerstiella sp.]|nr:hypothetical protein [Fuerstiella sp.]
MNHCSIQSTEIAAPVPLVQSRCVWIALLLWLGLAVPLFLGMPLNSDTALYDVQTRSLMNGGVAYRDIIEPNLPGVLWIHMAVRSLAGWSSEAIRSADLILFAAILCLWMRISVPGRRSRPVFLLAAALFYLTRNEWCHVQRDTWTLLPVGVAVILRLGRPVGPRLLAAVFEGFCWGCAFWIKPHVVIPGAAVMLIDMRGRSFYEMIVHFTAVVAGGVIAAVPGVAWLMTTGAWEHFQQMMLEWNPEYLTAARERMSFDRWVMMARRFAPWLWIHVVALPIAFASVRSHIRSGRTDSTRRQALLGGCYVGWLVQSVVLQHALDYVHVPAVILGLALICSHSWQMPIVARRSIVTGFLLCSVLWTPFFHGQRLQQWPMVLDKGSTVSVRAILAHGNLPDWHHLGRVIEFLRQQEVSDRDVTCLNVHSVHVYRETQTLPSTRYWSVSILQDLFPRRSAEIAEAVAASPHRYIITESRETRLIHQISGQSITDGLESVFESGSYRILAVDRDEAQIAAKVQDRHN